MFLNMKNIAYSWYKQNIIEYNTYYTTIEYNTYNYTTIKYKTYKYITADFCNVFPCKKYNFSFLL
jgi:hypothetical protein